MPRPKSKAELLELGEQNYEKLMKLVDSYPKSDQFADFPKGTLNRTIGDVLAHLHHWHLMLLEWYEIGMAGEKPDVPAKGHTWATTPELNREIWAKYKDQDLARTKKLLKQSFALVRKVIERHSNEELFEKKRYKWTGTTSLGAYLVSSTSSHYDWAYKLIRRVKK